MSSRMNYDKLNCWNYSNRHHMTTDPKYDDPYTYEKRMARFEKIELFKKVIAEQVHIYQKTNLVKSRTIDWEKKESARAGMRRMIKRLLKKYDYPPEGDEEAMTTVIQQCEMWTDNIQIIYRHRKKRGFINSYLKLY